MSPKLSNARALRILTAARDEFARRGLAGARVAAIARRAGVNKQLLFYYFNSKRGLYQAVLGRAADELESALDGLRPGDAGGAGGAGGARGAGGGRPLERIRAALDALYGYLAARPDLVNLITQSGAADARPFSPAIKRLVVLLAEGQGLGAVRDDVDPHLAAAQAIVLMLGYLQLESVVAASAPPLGADEPALRGRWKDAAIDLVLGGVRAG